MTVAEGEGFSATIDGRNQRFCAEGCRDFYLQELAERTGTEQARGNVTENRLFDPVCRMEVNTAWGFVHRHEGVDYHFCTERCRRVFADAPDDYLGERCMVCNRPMVTLGDFPATYMGNTYQLCSEEHRTEFKADPAGFFLHRMWGIPDWLYYVSIGILLLISYVMFEGRFTRSGIHKSQSHF